MTTWAAFLRGVNVGGITVKSAPLRECLAGLGLADVRTVLASGNAVFAGPDDRDGVKAAVEQGLRDTFGYDAWIVLLDAGEVRAAIDGCMLQPRAGWHTYFVLGSSDAVLAELVETAARTAPDEPVGLGPHVLYWQVPEGQTLHTPFAKVLARTAYRAATTTRNARTMARVAAVL